MATRSDEVTLVVPASPEFVRLARLMAAGIASRMGFSFEEVEDLRIAVDELWYCLIGPHPEVGTVRLTCSIGTDTLEMDGVAAVEGASRLHPIAVSEFSGRILDAVVDEYTLEADGARPSFRLIKRRAAS